MSRKGLIRLLPHHIKSGGLGLWLERRDYYSNPHLRQLARYKKVKQNLAVSLDSRVYPLQGILSIQESTLAPAFLYTHKRKCFPQLRLMFVKQNDVLCYSVISWSEERCLCKLLFLRYFEVWLLQALGTKERDLQVPELVFSSFEVLTSKL